MEFSGVQSVERAKDSGLILTYYERQFRARFGEAPVLDDEDIAVARWLTQKFELLRCKELVDAYLKIDNKWVSGRGFPFKLIKANINAILVAGGVKPKGSVPSRAMRVMLFCDVLGCGVMMSKDVAPNYNFDTASRCEKCEMALLPNSEVTVPVAGRWSELMSNLSFKVRTVDAPVREPGEEG